KTHAPREQRLFALHEIDGLVAIEADAMAGAMREAGKFVARAVAPLHVLRTHGVVDTSRRNVNSRGLDRDLLAVAHLLPHLALLGRGLAEYEGARDVGLIACHRAAAVHEYHFAVTHRLGLSRAMWIGAGFSQQDQRELGHGTERCV